MKVLILEDDSVHAFLFKKQITRLGHEPILCFSGFSAIEKVRKNEVDVVITDLAMPEMTGIDFIIRIREFSDIAIIVVSAYVQEFAKQAAFKVGANYYLCKPVLIDDLKAIFKQWE